MFIKYLCSLVLLVFAHKFADAKYAGIYFGGQFKPEVGCSQDGYYYNDETSFVRCVKSIPYVQKCPSGTVNKPLSGFDTDDEHHNAAIFCSINLLVIQKVNTVPAVHDTEYTEHAVTENAIQPTESVTEAAKVTEPVEQKTNNEEQALPESKDMPTGETDIISQSTSKEETAPVENDDSEVAQAPTYTEAVPTETESDESEDSAAEEKQVVSSVESQDENQGDGTGVMESPEVEPEKINEKTAGEDENQENAGEEMPTVREVETESSDESQTVTDPPIEDEIDMEVPPEEEESEILRYPDPRRYERPYERKVVNRGHSKEPVKEEIPKVPRYSEPNHPKNPYRRPYHPAYHRPFYLPSELDQYHEKDYYERRRYNKAMYYAQQEDEHKAKREERPRHEMPEEATYVNMRRAGDEDYHRKQHLSEQYERANKMYEEQLYHGNRKFDNDRVYRGDRLYNVDRYPGPYEHPAGYRQENPYYSKYFSTDH